MRRETQKPAAAGELALRVWDALLANHRLKTGSMTCTDLMRATGMGRSEIAFGLHELAQGGWVERVVMDRGAKLADCWRVVSRDHRHAEAEAAE